jgi:uncharacterized damage-inducible protein DinB
MSPHPLVTQLRFARSELVRCLANIPREDAVRRPLPMNCPSWVVGHLASQEQYLWLEAAQGRVPFPELYPLVGYGQPASTPPLDAMWDAWREVTAQADVYLDTLTTDRLARFFVTDGKPWKESIGTTLLRNLYHYWFHIGEVHAMRQMLGHAPLPQYVGDLRRAPYTPET